MEEKVKYPTKAGIYKITCNINKKIYIGKAVNLRRRICVHENTKINSRDIWYFQKAILKYGWNSFKVEILEIFDTFDKVKDNDSLLGLESYYIDMFDSSDKDKGYNLCKFSTDRTGIPMSDETKEKLRQANLGKKASDETKEKLRQANLGKTLSKEHREKMSKSSARKGIPRTEEEKEKIRQVHLGKPKSEETKQKMRLASLGKPKSEEHKAKIRQARQTDEAREKARQGSLGRKHSEETKEKLRKPKNKHSLNDE